MSGHVLKPKWERGISSGENPPQNREQPLSSTETDVPQQNLLLQIIANIGEPVVLADANAKVKILDPQAGALFGSSDSPQPLPIAGNRTRLDAYLGSFTFSFLNRQIKTFRFYDPRSRSEIEFTARSTKIYDSEGHLTHTLTVLRNLSGDQSEERARMERRMLEMEKFAATGKLAGTIAHEINNPMEAIKNAIYLLKDRLDPASQVIYDALKSEADRVTRIVRQMLGLYRNASHFGQFDLNAVIEDTLTLFARPLEKNSVMIEKRLGPLPSMKGSADQFRQLLSNLVVNAQDSMSSGGRLLIRTRFVESAHPGYGNIKLVVADTGCGIPFNIRSRMFEPFVTTKGEKGTGLGLWIVQGIVDGHTGSIQVHSSVDRGTVFRLMFPVTGD